MPEPTGLAIKTALGLWGTLFLCNIGICLAATADENCYPPSTVRQMYGIGTDGGSRLSVQGTRPCKPRLLQCAAAPFFCVGQGSRLCLGDAPGAAHGDSEFFLGRPGGGDRCGHSCAVSNAPSKACNVAA